MRKSHNRLYKRLLFGFILMDRNVLPYHCVSACFFSCGLLFVITTVVQVVEICGMSCWSPMDVANSIMAKASLPQGLSFIGILALLVLNTIVISFILTLFESKYHLNFDRIPAKIKNKLAIRPILFVFTSLFLMIITGFFGILVR